VDFQAIPDRVPVVVVLDNQTAENCFREIRIPVDETGNTRFRVAVGAADVELDLRGCVQTKEV